MNTLDWVLIFIFFIFTVLGFRKGAVAQAFGLAGLIGGLLLSTFYYRPVSGIVEKYLPTIRDSEMVSFIILFLLAWLAFTILSMVVNQYFKDGFAGIVNRLLGGVLGFAKGLLLSMALVSGATLLLPPNNAFLRESVMLPHIQQLIGELAKHAPKELEQMFQKKMNKLKDNMSPGSSV